MDFSKSELLTIKRAFIVYNNTIPSALRGKFYFIDSFTAKEDIKNMVNIESKLNLDDI